MSTSPVFIVDPVTRRSGYRSAAADLVNGVRQWELWTTIGWHEIRQRYRRSVVGPFWLTISMGVMIGGMAYLYAGLFGQSLQEYLPYVAVGIIVFNLISVIATESASIFINASRFILQMQAPLSVYLYQMLWRNFLIFCHNIIIYVIILFFIHISLGPVTLLAIPGICIILISGLWVGIILGGLSARFRDVPPIVASIMQVAFFLTPVFWHPEALHSRAIFLEFNPFYYMLEIVRMPLLGKYPGVEIWAGALAINLISALAAFVFLARFRARIPYWV